MASRRSLATLAVLAAFTLSACSGSSSSPDPSGKGGPDGNPSTVTVVDSAFQPEALTVPVGTTVSWEWVATTLPHNVVADEGAFTSGDLQTEGSYTFTFDTAGTYSYHCIAHQSAGMVGTITVT